MRKELINVCGENNNVLKTLINQTSESTAKQMLGLSYHPVQHADWARVYDVQTALERGTVFPELNLPYVGKGMERR